MDDIKDLRKKLKKTQQECARLREEKEHLKNLLQIKSFDSERSSIRNSGNSGDSTLNSRLRPWLRFHDLTRAELLET